MRHMLVALVALLAVIALLNLTACEPNDHGSGTVFSDARPPVRYQTPRTFVLSVRPAAELMALCAKLRGFPPPDGKYYAACNTASLNTVYAPDPCAYPGEKFARHICHEEAHLRLPDGTPGWPANHPVR